MVELDKLFQMQQALDAHIEEKHGLENEDLFSRKMLALLVEIGELANETRCFKFWSVKPASEKSVILEEYVDGIHFLLSLGIECGFHQAIKEINAGETAAAVTDQFLTVYEKANGFKNSKTSQDYLALFESFLQLAGLLGMTNEEILQAYFAKNEVNYQRQENNY